MSSDRVCVYILVKNLNSAYSDASQAEIDTMKYFEEAQQYCSSSIISLWIVFT